MLTFRPPPPRTGGLAVGAHTVWLATLLLGRDAAMAVAAIYYRYASLPAPKTLTRYWDFSLPSAAVHPTAVSKLNTFLQLVLVGATLALPLVLPSPTTTTAPAVPLPLGVATDDVRAAISGLQAIVAATTVASGASYVWKRDAVTILGADEALKRRQGIRGRMILGVSLGAVLVLAGFLAAREIGWEEEQKGE
jgi:cardiolipin synthase (CMP-forming)